MDLVFCAFAVLAFSSVSLMAEGLYLWWAGARGAGARRIARRLGLVSEAGKQASPPISIVKHRSYGQGVLADMLLRRTPLTGVLDRRLAQAGVRWSVAQFLALSGMLLGVSLLLVQMWPMPPLAAFIVCALFTAIPSFLLGRARQARLRTMERQLPDAVDFLARALRAGHSFGNALNMAGMELPEPIGSEFRTAHNEISLGLSVNDALHNLGVRIPLTDVRYLVIAVVIQRESGGNLSEILGNIGSVVRQRLKLYARVRVLSAEGRMSAWVLGVLPFVVLFTMSILNRPYASLLWTEPAGVTLLWYAAGMLALGAWWLRNLIRIRV